MNFNKIILTLASVLCISFTAFSQDETYLYGTHDGQDLYMDEYRPEASKSTFENGKDKPTIIFIFGGGFMEGKRNSNSYIPWFERLASDGYRVFSIDYRLGLKNNTKSGLAFVKATHKAIEMGVEDLFSATSYILENAEMLGVNPENIVVSGSSAGAIISLQAEWILSNSLKYSEMLPEGFNYSGVMSFSGAILSDQGTPKYNKRTAPALFFHGTDDQLVVYRQLKLFNWAYSGSSVLASQYKKSNVPFAIYRFDGYTHEIAGSMEFNYDKEIAFLENVIGKESTEVVDETITESEYPKGTFKKTKKELYSKKK